MDSPETNPPDWSRLPHDPEGFFELSEGFDRRDLKRSYNRLLRQFKPEKFPAEFQKLRAAFEALDHNLRYGQRRPRKKLDTQPFQWHNQLSPERPPPQGNRAQPNKPQPRSLPPEEEAEPSQAPRVKTFDERLQSEPPEKLFRELKSKQNKTPYDFYTLAVLSDTLAERDSLQFIRWLLLGLKAYPEDYGLYYLVESYFRSEIPTAAAAKILLAASQVVNESRFYYLTEPLWDRLLKKSGFSQFRQTLAACEKRFPALQVDGKLAFTIHILRATIWKADPAWTETAFEWIEENFQMVPGHLEYDVEMLFYLRKYIENRGTFLNGNPIRAQIDQTLFSYGTEDSVRADQIFAQCQVELAQKGQELLDAFQYEWTSGFEEVYEPWSWISEEVAGRVGVEDQESNEVDWQPHVRQLVSTINHQSHRTSLGKIWEYSGFGYLAAATLAYLVPFLLTWLILATLALILPSDIPRFLVHLISAGIGAAVAAFAGAYIKRRWFDDAWQRAVTNLSVRIYRKVWRNLLFRFIQRTHMSSHELAARLETMGDGSHMSDWVKVHCEHDYGLAFYSVSQRFLA